MGKRRGWLSSGLLLVVIACSQDVTAPGACPDFCPSTKIRVRDTVLVANIVRDSSFRGYVQAHQAVRMQVSAANGGPGIEARGVIRFLPFSDSLIDAEGRRPIVQTDSFTINFLLAGRSLDVPDLGLAVHRLPATVDSLVTHADVDPFFDDSTLVGIISIPDSVADSTVTGVLPPEGLEGIEADSSVIAIGLALRAPAPTFVNIVTVEGALGVTLTRYVKIDSVAGELAERMETRGALMDTYVAPPLPAPTGGALAVGGLPSARTIIRLNLPPAIIDSGDIVRATLVLVPNEPVRGAPGDSVRLFVEGLSADFGPKSPIIPGVVDTTTGVGSLQLPVGSMDTIRIDVTRTVLPWKSTPALPRSLILRVRPEGAVLGEVRIGSSRTAGFRPALRVTYVPPSLLGRN